MTRVYLSTLLRRGFHSAFEEGASGALHMRAWSTIHEGISRSSSRPFTLLFVFGGMQMTSADTCDVGARAMGSSACTDANARVLNAYRVHASPTATGGDAHSVQQQQQQQQQQQPRDGLQRRVLVISRNGTWWRRWLNEQVHSDVLFWRERTSA